MTDQQPTLHLMSRETFDAHLDEIRAAINLLVAGGNTAQRKRFRLIEVYERRSGEILLEVFKAGLGLVIHYIPGAMSQWSRSAFVPLPMRQLRGRWRIGPLSDDPDAVVYVCSRAVGGHDIRHADLVRILTEDLDPAEFQLPSYTNRLAFRR